MLGAWPQQPEIYTIHLNTPGDQYVRDGGREGSKTLETGSILKESMEMRHEECAILWDIKKGRGVHPLLPFACCQKSVNLKIAHI